jgi:hypothetical protein
MNDDFNSPMHDGPYNFEIPPTSADSSMSLPYRGQDGPINFQSPHQTPDHMAFQSPTPGGNMHQDSGIDFSTPSHDQQYNFNSPKDSGMVYNDSKMYQSPAPMQHLTDDHNVYQQSPLGQSTPGQASDIDMQNMGLYIDPNNLSQPHH